MPLKQVTRLALVRTPAIAGRINAARMPMMAMVTSNSINVKPRREDLSFMVNLPFHDQLRSDLRCQTTRLAERAVETRCNLRREPRYSDRERPAIPRESRGRLTR